MDWLDFKNLADQIGLEKDALHVYAALLLHVAAGFAFRRPLSHWLPWVIVLAAAVANEVLDISFGNETSVQEWQVLGARHDILNTMVLPTLLMLLSRYAPGLFRRPAPAEELASADRDDGELEADAAGSGAPGA